MKITRIIAATAIMVFTALATQAQTATPDKVKIANGVQSGELTKPETRKLVKQQRNIRQDKRAAKSDGVVTTAERRNIKQEKKRADANIYVKKHNNRVRN